MMQQMQEPERRGYSGEYLGDPEYTAYKGRQDAVEEIEEGERLRYGDGEWEQQKLQPRSRSERIQRIIAIVLMVVTSPMLGFSIALFGISATNLANISTIAQTQEVADKIVGSFVLSLIVMLFVIAAFAASMVQLILIEQKFRRQGKRRGR
ncbi:MAG: hypothetical protein J2P37_16965 [Ktedonobacteraceae bacterium]|nr:hypothetical protein [Ktedonobacteraceae bacterium]MBO0794104.1 hypothetical protein [Ktedonobacteraceae bacterium]